MKKKLLQYKWSIAVLSVVVLSIGVTFYGNTQLKDGVLIEDDGETQIQTIEQSSNQIVEEGLDVENQVESNVDIDDKKQVPVYICGAVQTPGVYYVSQDAIINDVVEKCGGFTSDADIISINLASPILANEKIIIPKQGEKIDKFEDSYENRERIETLPGSQLTSQSSKVEPSDNNKLININTATKEQLMTLNGIGETKAEAIIVYRQENGEFKSIDEIMEISGIGEKTFEKLKQFITT